MHTLIRLESGTWTPQTWAMSQEGPAASRTFTPAANLGLHRGAWTSLLPPGMGSRRALPPWPSSNKATPTLGDNEDHVVSRNPYPTQV